MNPTPEQIKEFTDRIHWTGSRGITRRLDKIDIMMLRSKEHVRRRIEEIIDEIKCELISFVLDEALSGEPVVIQISELKQSSINSPYQGERFDAKINVATLSSLLEHTACLKDQTHTEQSMVESLSTSAMADMLKSSLAKSES